MYVRYFAQVLSTCSDILARQPCSLDFSQHMQYCLRLLICCCFDVVSVAYLKSWEKFQISEHISRDIDVSHGKSCYKVYICETLVLQLWTEPFNHCHIDDLSMKALKCKPSVPISVDTPKCCAVARVRGFEEKVHT